MRKKSILAVLAFLVVGFCLFLQGCTDTDAPAPSDTTAETKDITLTGTDMTGYTLIVPKKTTDTESAAMLAVYKSANKASFKMGNDNFPEIAEEILIGATNRPQSAAAQSTLDSLKKEGSFHYILACTDGKLVILADDPLGYTYALDRIESDFIRSGKLYIPADLNETVSVTMEEYYNSKFYAEELAKIEEDKQRQLVIEAANARAREERLERIKDMNLEFTRSDFGNLMTFPADAYEKPEIYPVKGQHPRVFFTETKLGEIRQNMTAEENAEAYKQYIKMSDSNSSYGKLLPLSETKKQNSDHNILGAIMAKAFRYAAEGDEDYGYEAIVSIKNYILTLDVDASVSSGLYYYGYAMHVAGCVYDWCYDLLTDADKEQIVAGCITRLAPKLEIGVPPNKQGALVGHGCGGQLLQNWLTLAIACYDEYPDMYEFVAGRIFEEFVPGQNYFLESGAHHQGNAYGLARFENLICAQLLFNRMTDEGHLVFSDGVRDTVTTFIHYVRPDGQGIRIGDDFSEFAKSYDNGLVWEIAMCSFALYKDPHHKGYAKEYSKDFTTKFEASTYSGISGLLFLLLNDPAVEARPFSESCLVQYNGSPTGAIVARSAWDDPDAALVYMKVGEAYSANHEHKDAGTFQIFYKGILASDSGSYYLYGTEHDKDYYKQTIAHNSLLIYNPNLVGKFSWEYSGGQSLRTLSEISTLDRFLASKQAGQAKIIGHAYEATDKEYTFSYLAGDLTNAYDAETVDEVSRYMLSMMTDDEECPMVFAVYDRITADDPSYKKTFLLHIQQEPTVTDDGFAVVTNTIRENSGKMIVQSCITDMEYTVIGGEGREYWVNGVNVTNDTLDEHFGASRENHIDEVGWGRIELSPSAAAGTDHLLTLMYVTDAANDAAPIKAAEVETEDLLGAVLFNRAALFAKDGDRLHKETTFTVSAEGTTEYYIAGIAAGKWTVSVNGKLLDTLSVTEDSGLLRFTADPGTVTITPVQ